MTGVKISTALNEEWSCKRKGTAKIYTHPQATGNRAVVKNHLGVFFNGEEFPTLETAKQTALSHLTHSHEPSNT